MSKAKTLATTVSTGGVLDNPSAIPAANISGAVGSATNLAGGSNGTIPYQSASGTTQMLAVGTASQVLTSAGVGAPTWANPAATGVTSVAATVPSIFSIAGSPITSTGTLAMTYSGTALPIANGGTGTTLTTFADLTTNVIGTLPIANGGTGTTSTTFANLTTNVTGTLPIANGGTGTTSTTFANLTTNVTGTLPIANGGTGTTSTTFANLTTNVTGTLPIANGGTNSTATPTAGTVPYGTGTAFAFTSVGTSGQFLQSNGASAPSWVAPSSGAMVFISETSLSGNTVNTSIDNATYSAYRFYIFGLSTTASGGSQNNIIVRFNNNTNTANYFFRANALQNAYSSYSSSSTGLIYLNTAGYIGSSGTYSETVILDIFNIKSNSQSLYNMSGLVSVLTDFANQTSAWTVGGFVGAITSMQLSNDSAANFVGKMRIYGIV